MISPQLPRRRSAPGRGLRGPWSSWRSAVVCQLLSMGWACQVIAQAPLADDSLTAGYLLAPKAFQAAANQVRPSIVTLYGFGGKEPTRAPGIGLVQGGPSTGLIVSTDGYILTSTFNLLRRPPVITVELHDGTQFVAELLGRDNVRKICLLKIDPTAPLPVPRWLPRSEVVVGQWAVAMGVGFAGRPALSQGIVSASHRIFSRALQTDAKISPVNYGGPLVNIDGQVMGICVPLHPQSREVAAGTEWYDSGIGFAIPVHENLALIETLKSGATIEAGWLGVRVQAATEEGDGILVTDVVPESPAAEAGFQPQDRILEVDGEAVPDTVALSRQIGRSIAGDELRVLVERDGEQVLLPVTLSVRKSPPPAEPPRS